MGDVLKQFAMKITTSGVKERERILAELTPCLAMPGTYIDTGFDYSALRLSHASVFQINFAF